MKNIFIVFMVITCTMALLASVGLLNNDFSFKTYLQSLERVFNDVPVFPQISFEWKNINNPWDALQAAMKNTYELLRYIVVFINYLVKMTEWILKLAQALLGLGGVFNGININMYSYSNYNYMVNLQVLYY